jgi:maltose-binding protein MalE
MELLNLGQRKHSPLAEVSSEFLEQHPNPYIEVFIEVAKRPRTFSAPKTPVWSEFTREMGAAFDEVWLGRLSAEEALRDVTDRMQLKLDRAMESIRRREAEQ